MTPPGRRLRDIFRNAEADAADEIAFHLEMRERDFHERGMSPLDAHVAARRRFGDPTGIARQIRAIDDRAARQRRRTGMWTDFSQDVVYALRGLRKSPGFALVAGVTLALGIGANTAIFSVFNAALLRPLPFADADRLVFLWNRTTDGGPSPLGPGRMRDFRRQMTSVESSAALAHISYTLTGGGDPESLPGASVSSAFFDVLGARPLLGDTFHADRADPSAVVLGYGLWARRFGADRSIVGRTVTLNGRPRLVVAVMPRDFYWPFITASPSGDGGPQLWVPGGPGDVPRPATNEDADVTGDRNTGYIRLVARLKKGVTVGQADAEARALGARLSREYPEDGGRTALIVTLREQFFGGLERPLWVLAGAVGFVLAIACANVASLLLGRGAARQRDLALRRALGAGRLRIFRQLLTESAVLACLGGTAGALLAWWGTTSLLEVAPPDIAAGGATFDLRVLTFTLAAALGSALAFGVLPALQFSRVDLAAALSEGATRSTGSRRSGRIRDLLVVGEIAVALVLLVGASLLVRSFVALSRVDTGIDTHNLLTFNIRLAGPRAEYQARQVEFYAALQRRLEAIPGVVAAGSAVTLPIGGDDYGSSYLVEGRPTPPPGDEPHAGFDMVMPGYFKAMGIPLVAGRDVRDSDARTSPRVVVVNQSLARQQWPGTDPIGRRIVLNGDSLTVVGVVGDIRHLGPSVPPRAELYQPSTQRSFPFMAFVVRTSGEPYAMVPTIRRAVAELDPALPLSDVKSMDDHLARAMARPRFLSTLVTAFGALAMTLAVIGIYGVMSWSVSERRREFAIRMALGIRGPALLAGVLRHALLLAAAGVGFGLIGARAATHVLDGLLFGVQATDAVALGLSAGLLAAVAMAACVLPARRALRVDPVALLR
ncbi:MAG TPA: ABC transporter permease [Vicinamibacterales bacterium]